MPSWKEISLIVGWKEMNSLSQPCQSSTCYRFNQWSLCLFFLMIREKHLFQKKFQILGENGRDNPYTLLAFLQIWEHWPTSCSSTSTQCRIWQLFLNHKYCFFMACTRRRTLTSMLISIIFLQSVLSRRRDDSTIPGIDYVYLASKEGQDSLRFASHKERKSYFCSNHD